MCLIFFPRCTYCISWLVLTCCSVSLCLMNCTADTSVFQICDMCCYTAAGLLEGDIVIQYNLAIMLCFDCLGKKRGIVLGCWEKIAYGFQGTWRFNICVREVWEKYEFSWFYTTCLNQFTVTQTKKNMVISNLWNIFERKGLWPLWWFFCICSKINK